MGALQIGKFSRFLRAVWALIPLIILAATFACPALAEQDKEKAGQALVAERCGACHAVGSDDVSAHEEAPALRGLWRDYPVEALAEALAEGIMSGHPDMPVLEFEAEEVDAIIAYLQSIQTK